MRTALIVGTVLLTGGLARADNMASKEQIADVLVAEQVCELTYDKQAVQALTSKGTTADDQASESVRGLMTVGVRARFEKMSAAEKLAFCARQSRSATNLGLIK